MRLLHAALTAEISKSVRYKGRIGINYLFIGLLIVLEYSIYTGVLGQHDERVLPYLIISFSLNICLLTHRLPQFVRCLRRGELAKYRVYPISTWRLVVIEDLAESVVLLLEHMVLIIPFVIIFHYPITACLLCLCSVVLSLILAVMIGELFYALTFILNNSSASKALLMGVTSLLSGGIIPLILMPQRFVDLCYYTPFALLIDGPLRVLQEGNVSVLASQLLWILVMGVLSYVAIERSLEHMEVSGG